MTKAQPIYLGVNIDHVATLRQARGTDYPDPIEAALLAENAGADGITLHLREDRRHIQDADLKRLKAVITTRMNLEMAVTDEMIAIAKEIRPAHCCLVPEKREELTTEGGLDVTGQFEKIKAACAQLAEADIDVSLFIAPDPKQIEAAVACGAPTIELHTGAYAEATTPEGIADTLKALQQAIDIATQLPLTINAGHGLHYENVAPIAALPALHELNIGHAIVAKAVFIGFEAAVAQMKAKMLQARGL